METLFLERMKNELKEDYEAFVDSLSSPLLRGLRYDPRKLSREKLEANVPLGKPSPFCPQSFYVDRPLGNHPYHLAGAFYLQEPSASSAVQILDVQPEDIVLDLCAAPGGKSTQIASHLDDGILVCNEYDSKRAMVLLSNLERMGVQNFVLTQGEVGPLCEELHDCFDKVLVDAPCSGEGMMKKHDAAMQSWSLEHVQACARRQKEILSCAYRALKKDGILVYSTCTYSKEENEEVIAAFLKEHPDMIQIDPDCSFGRRGIPTLGMDAQKVVRIYPMDGGEGHFVCKMQKTAGTKRALPIQKLKKRDRKTEEALGQWIRSIPKHILVQKDHVYVMDHPFLKLSQVRVLRQGVLAGTWIKNRLEPAHALFQAFSKENYVLTQELSLEQMDEVMHGAPIVSQVSKGYVAYCIDGSPFGFGKSDGHRINNKIPKGLRLLPGSHVKKEIEKHER